MFERGPIYTKVDRTSAPQYTSHQERRPKYTARPGSRMSRSYLCQAYHCLPTALSTRAMWFFDWLTIPGGLSGKPSVRDVQLSLARISLHHGRTRVTAPPRWFTVTLVTGRRTRLCLRSSSTNHSGRPSSSPNVYLIGNISKQSYFCWYRVC